MRQRIISCLAAFSFLLLPTSGFAQYKHGLISVGDLQRNGLQRQWFTQIQVNPSRSHVVGVMQHISSTHAMTVFEVKYKGGKVRYLDRQYDRFGERLGKEGAAKLARQKSIQLTRSGFENKVEERTLPEITLYASTSSGMLHAIDGETGRTRWTALVGNRNHPTLTPSANDKYVAVVNGSFLYMLDRNTGRQLWSRRVVSAPGAGPAMSNEMVFVPTISGKLESFLLSDYKEPSGVFQAIGRSLVRPIITSRSVAWPTDRGHMYVAPSMKKGIRFRVEARDTIMAPASFRAPSTFFMTSVDGYVYSFLEANGAMVWNYSIGEEISQSAVPIGEFLYVVTDEDNLYALNIETGEPVWTSSQVRRFMSGTEKRLYVTGTSGRLAIIDAKTGARLSSISTEELDLKIENMQTDRLFIGTRKGLIQCIREVENEYPILHGDVEEEEKPADPGAPKDPAAGPGATPPTAPPAAPPKDEPNPFGDPPAGGGGAKPADPNPFGGGTNPFGGDSANPFGASNPFNN